MKRIYLLVCCILCFSACVHRRYENRLPFAFDGHPWGQRIEEFEGLEYSGSTSVHNASCYLPLRSQVSSYVKPGESYKVGDVRPTRVEYLFGYRGVTPRFGGTFITFQSEEFDLASYPDTPKSRSSYEQVRDALVREYGPPHSGILPKGTVKIIGEDGLVVPSNTQTQRYSWCGPGDPHAPRHCQVAVVLEFVPLLGEGWVLYATPEMQGLLQEWQENDRYPDSLYELVFANRRSPPKPLRLGCDVDDARNQKPFKSLGPSDASDVISEKALDTAAYQHAQVREVPIRHLTPLETFGQLSRVEEGLDQNRDDSLSVSYLLGYAEAVRYIYYAGRYHTGAVHRKWLERAGVAHTLTLRLFSLGYRDGLTLKFNLPTVRAANKAGINDAKPDGEGLTGDSSDRDKGKAGEPAR